MKITKIAPRGFCHGVVNAWDIAKKVAKNNLQNKKIYMIGWLVHNKELLKDLQALGIETIEDTKDTRLNIIKKIKEPSKSIVIFSAHGSDPKAIELAKQKKIEFYDATCNYVYDTHNIVKQKIQEGFTILFIGKLNHPETNSVLSLNPNINLLVKEEDVDNLKIKGDEKIFVTNQTTISIYEFYNIIKKIKSKFKNIEFKNDICNATKERQDAVINMDETIDLLLVVGDKRSNNSNKLVEIAKQKNIESYLIETKKDINMLWLENKKNIGITSGCSTPTWITNDVIIFLNEYIETKN